MSAAPRRAPESVLVIGAGKVGRALHAGLRAAGVEASLRRARTLLTRPLPLADLVVIASRDGRIEEIAKRLAEGERLPRAVVHCAGALGLAPLSALSARGVAVASMHPCLSFPSDRARVALGGGALVASGDRAAVARVKSLARVLGMRAICPASLDRAAYHTACALAANGAAALAEAASRLLVAAGISPRDAQRTLGPLLVSVGHNVASLSAAEALSGPVARGDVATLRAHESALTRVAADLLPLYRSMVAAQRALLARRKTPKGPAPEGPALSRPKPLRKPLRDPKNMRKRAGKAP